MRLGITGIVAAPHTPFGPDGALATGVVPEQARLLKDARVAGAFICGTTGEGHSLSVQERFAVAGAWKEALPPGMRLLVHVGHNSLPEARRLADHARGIGADGIAALSPSFYRPPGVDELAAFCREVAAAAPSVPFYYYDIPAMTGVDPSMVEFARHAMESIPTFAGIKFTRKDPPEFGRLVDLAGDRLDLFFGYDECLIEGLRRGAKAAVGSTYNYAAPVYHRIMTAFADGDTEAAARLQEKSVDLVARLEPFTVLAAGKALVGMMGVDCGPVRLPNRPLSPSDLRRLYDAVRDLDLFVRPLREPA